MCFEDVSSKLQQEKESSSNEIPSLKSALEEECLKTMTQSGQLKALREHLGKSRRKVEEQEQVIAKITQKYDSVQHDYKTFKQDCGKERDLRKKYSYIRAKHKSVVSRLEKKERELESVRADAKSTLTKMKAMVEKCSKANTDFAKENSLAASYAKSLKESNLKLKRSIDEGKAKDKLHEKRTKELIQNHGKELELARHVASSERTTPGCDAATMETMKNELKRTRKNLVDLQQNFNTIAMQNVKHGNELEMQREEIQRLEQLSKGYGSFAMPLKIEE